MPDLHFVPRKQFQNLLGLDAPSVPKTQAFAELCRINTLYMIARAGSGHLGSSFSSLDIVSWLYLNEIRQADSIDSIKPHPFRDLYFSSKGHDVPGLYSVLIALGVIDFEFLHRLRRLGGLPGHPDVSTPGIVTNTGSLGMGVSKAKGMILGHRLKGEDRRVFVMCGDGELQEGQFWESLVSAVNLRMNELIVIVDHNKIQSDVWVAQTSDLGDLEEKLRAFGWHFMRCNGHDMAELGEKFSDSLSVSDRPHVIIADTYKGAGVSFMRHQAAEDEQTLYPYHSGAPTEEEYEAALEELSERAEALLVGLGLQGLNLEKVGRLHAPLPPPTPQRLVNAYARALVEQAIKRKDIVVLDADLKLDCGLISFQERFPDRFIECGIAEQDMVSMAGGLALEGKLPVVHSFASFLSMRPNEQIYNNATEKTKIIYVGFLAGLLPSGPGHSHQSVRDISSLGSIPGLVLAEPSCEVELTRLLDYAMGQPDQSFYLRLVSVPCSISFRLPMNYAFEEGRGTVLVNGCDALIIGYGPVLLEQAYRAACRLKKEEGLEIKVVNLPWLNRVDVSWLESIVEPDAPLITLDNHYAIGGQGQMIRSACAGLGMGALRVVSLGLEEIPPCGMNDEVLLMSQLNEREITKAVKKAKTEF